MRAATGFNIRLEDNLAQSLPIHTLRTARRGRPFLVIDPEWLKDATSSQRRIPQTKLAAALGIHRNTFRNKMRLNKLTRSFAPLSDDDLDTILRAFKVEKPNSGLRYALGFLKQNGVHIQKSRVRLSLRRIDGLRQALRNHAAINRREYVVPYPNYLWHIDGRHKLIRWAIVIHGGADGFDRVVSF